MAHNRFVIFPVEWLRFWCVVPWYSPVCSGRASLLRSDWISHCTEWERNKEGARHKRKVIDKKEKFPKKSRKNINKISAPCLKLAAPGLPAPWCAKAQPGDRKVVPVRRFCFLGASRCPKAGFMKPPYGPKDRMMAPTAAAPKGPCSPPTSLGGTCFTPAVGGGGR